MVIFVSCGEPLSKRGRLHFHDGKFVARPDIGKGWWVGSSDEESMKVQNCISGSGLTNNSKTKSDCRISGPFYRSNGCSKI